MMSILAEVRKETRPWHDKMEEVARSDKIAAGTLSIAEYKAVILGHYVFHQQAEKRLKANELLKITQGLQLDERFKTPSLLQDMRQLNMEPLIFDFCPDLHLDTLPRALGCMYVMEGATLGGTVIGRSLQKVPEITSSGAMHYYGCYGDQTGKRWKQFKEIVEREVSTEDEGQAFVHAATVTFRQYAECMERAFQQLEITATR